MAKKQAKRKAPKPPLSGAIRKSAATSRAADERAKATRNRGRFEKGLVFVAMAFKGSEGADVFSAIKEVCKQLRLKARRVDENFTSGFIILEIVHLIEQAEFIVFDLTHERPNVYYELGYAHGVGNDPSNILLLAKAGTKLHFDIQSLRVMFYDSTEDLRRLVKANLGAAIKESRQ
jgi:hypothetical protein